MKRYILLYGIQLAVIAVLSAFLFLEIYIPEFLPRKIHRLLHITGAIVFLGNIIVSALWFTLASGSRKQEIFTHAAKLINITDLAFTGPGLILLLLNGNVLSAVYGNLLLVPWLKWAFIWFMAAGFIWTVMLIPLQLRYVKQAEKEVFPWSNTLEKKYTIFYAIGGSATIVFIAISFVYMVLK